MSTFLVLTNKQGIDISPTFSQVKISESVSLFFDKGSFKNNSYLYTGIHKTLPPNYIPEFQPNRGIPSNDILDISDEFCIIYPPDDNHLRIITDRYGKVPIFYYERNKEFIVTTDLNENLTAEFKLLNPSKFISINVMTSNIELHSKLPLATYSPELDKDGYIDLLFQTSEAAVLNAIKNYNKIGVLYSGGVDSSIIVQILKKNDVLFTGYVVGEIKSPDMIAAQKAAKILKIDLRSVPLDETKIECNLKQIDEIIQSKQFFSTTQKVPRVVSLEVAIVLYFGIQEASKDDCDVILSAIGTEEMFVGFSLEARHLEQNKPLVDIVHEKMASIYIRDMYRNYRISSFFNIDLKTPFVSTRLFDIALAIPIDLKIVNQTKKFIWRQAGISLGLPEEIAFRRNKATQFGSASSKLLSRVAKKHGFKYKLDFINHFLE